MSLWVYCTCVNFLNVCDLCLLFKTLLPSWIFSFYLSLLGVSFNSVYTQIWRVLLHLAADPFPEVSDLAMKVLNSIAYKVRYVRVFKAFITNCVLKTDFHLAQSQQSKNRITTFSWVGSKTWPVVSRQLQWISLFGNRLQVFVGTGLLLLITRWLHKLSNRTQRFSKQVQMTQTDFIHWSIKVCKQQQTGCWHLTASWTGMRLCNRVVAKQVYPGSNIRSLKKIIRPSSKKIEIFYNFVLWLTPSSCWFIAVLMHQTCFENGNRLISCSLYVVTLILVLLHSVPKHCFFFFFFPPVWL